MIYSTCTSIGNNSQTDCPPDSWFGTIINVAAVLTWVVTLTACRASFLTFERIIPEELAVIVKPVTPMIAEPLCANSM